MSGTKYNPPALGVDKNPIADKVYNFDGFDRLPQNDGTILYRDPDTGVLYNMEGYRVHSSKGGKRTIRRRRTRRSKSTKRRRRSRRYR